MLDPEPTVGHSPQLYWIWNDKTHLMYLAAQVPHTPDTSYAR